MLTAYFECKKNLQTCITRAHVNINHGMTGGRANKYRIYSNGPTNVVRLVV